MTPIPVSIQRLVYSLERHQPDGSCFEIVVESNDYDRLDKFSSREGETSSPTQRDWIAVIASAFQNSTVQFIRTIPSSTARQNPVAKHSWIANFQSQALPATPKSTSEKKVVKVLDSITPLLHHTGSWREVLQTIENLRNSCHVLIIGLLCDALSRARVQSIEDRACAIISDNILLRRGVQEYDQWLREDLLRGELAEKNEPMQTSLTPKGVAKIFLQGDDPDLDDDDDPDDDLDL